MPERQISILKGSAFVVSDRLGDVTSAIGNPNGLFYRDMRHLSRWQLRLNGRELDVLSAEMLKPMFFDSFDASETGVARVTCTPGGNVPSG